MKKFYCIIIATMITMLLFIPAFADEYIASYDGMSGEMYNDGQTTLTYDVPDSYMIAIPSTVTIGDTMQIYGQDVNLSYGKVINVSYFAADTDGDAIILRNDDNDQIRATFTYEGGTIMPQNGTIGTIHNNGDSVTIYTNIDNVVRAKAGTYTGTVSFNFEIGTE